MWGCDEAYLYGCTKKAAKQLFLSLLNGGDVHKWMYDFKISRRLQKDLREGRVEHPGIVQQLRTEYATIQRIMFTIAGILVCEWAVISTK